MSSGGGTIDRPPSLVNEIRDIMRRLSDVETQAAGIARASVRAPWVPLDVVAPFDAQGVAEGIAHPTGEVFVRVQFLWSGDHVGATILTLPEDLRPREGFIAPIAVDLGVSTEFGAVTLSDLGGVRLAAQPTIPDAAVGHISVMFRRTTI